MIVRFKRFHPNAVMPSYAMPGDAGCDLHVGNTAEVPLWPGETRVYWCDIGIELPEGYEAQVRPRSSTAKRGLLVHLGTIDAGYRGALGVTVTNLTREHVIVRAGDRLAQLVIAPVACAVFVEADELSESARGTSGYGSTGT